MASIYEIKLHELLILGRDLSVIRVPGGWIYTIVTDTGYNNVFVPFNNEFKETK